MQLTIAHDHQTLLESLAKIAQAGKRLALVPTMGALHAGHQSLIRLAKEQADSVLVTIFVNPTQFGPNEDFDKYPRSLPGDLEKITEAGGDLVYAPTVEDMYPQGFSTKVTVGPLADRLCGASRPGHFDGVATVVSKLLLRTLPHVAIFGEKDFQQLAIIRHVTDDLDIPVEIIGAPIIREADGLAMSSRNSYLSSEERKLAPLLHTTMRQVADKILVGVDVTACLSEGVQKLTHAGFRVDYLELRDEDDLETQSELSMPSRLLAAAWLGNTRLIDNIAMEPVHPTV